VSKNAKNTHLTHSEQVQKPFTAVSPVTELKRLSYRTHVNNFSVENVIAVFGG
jgi:hypothetical protein